MIKKILHLHITFVIIKFEFGIQLIVFLSLNLRKQNSFSSRVFITRFFTKIMRKWCNKITKNQNAQLIISNKMNDGEKLLIKTPTAF